jgi:hypothetical protein
LRNNIFVLRNRASNDNKFQSIISVFILLLIEVTMSTPSMPIMPPALRLATGLAPSHLLYCSSCPSKIASDWKPNNKYGWCVQLSCDKCTKDWFVCKFCPRNINQYYTVRQMKRHNSRIHALSKEQQVAAESQPLTPVNLTAA